jgi:hypothetical protein
MSAIDGRHRQAPSTGAIVVYCGCNRLRLIAVFADQQANTHKLQSAPGKNHSVRLQQLP